MLGHRSSGHACRCHLLPAPRVGVYPQNTACEAAGLEVGQVGLTEQSAGGAPGPTEVEVR